MMRSYQAGILAGTQELREQPAEPSVALEQPDQEQGSRPHIVTDPRPTLEFLHYAFTLYILTFTLVSFYFFYCARD